ncbi:hypothetical protein [Flavisphingomonas formosensis]|uniref:hypothetical protein n=1 Tax=Flavisphingomonas formosensis TaxID=861534 RepID=UPI0012FBF7A6|nr:hypothetical protein [Sphingomonas formosensis]
MNSIDSLFSDQSDHKPDEVDEVEDTAEEAEAPEPIEEPSEEIEPAETVQIEPQVEAAPKAIPLAAMLDERDKRKEAERKAIELERQLEEIRKANEVQKPDIYSDDPYLNDFRERMEAQFERQRFQDRILDSDERAKEKYGAEVVEKAALWAKDRMQDDPAFRTKFLENRRPMEWVVEQHQQETRAAEILSDPDAWVRKRAAELGLIGEATGTSPETAENTQPAAKAPSRSIASFPSQGGISDTLTGKNSAIASLFS